METGSACEAINWRQVKTVHLLQPSAADAEAGAVLEMLTAAEELAQCPSLDTLTRRVVEIARDRLGLERVSLFLNDESTDLLRGTYSTDADGEVVDERHVRFALGEVEREAQRRAEAGVSRWLQLRGAVGAPDQCRTWQILTPLRSQRGPVGILHNAVPVTRSPEASKQVGAAVLASLVGGLIENLREPNPLTRARHPSVKCGALVRKTIALLNEDPTLTAEAIAARLSVSPARLARTFRAEVSVSLVQYRNRLRLERFFGLVQHRGGSFSDAAQTAGFGSYAQFHRIFRQHVGVAPREYLTMRAAV